MKLRNSNILFYLSFIPAFLILVTSCGSDTAAPPPLKVLTAENTQKLQAAADNIMMNYQAPGMVAYIATEGEGELYITRGVGNLVTTEPISKNNYFRIASITKTFTAEAVLLLVDKGLIDLDKPISFYLPELHIQNVSIEDKVSGNKIYGDKITVRMLGNMTSGLFNYSADSDLTALYTSLGEKIFTPEELVAMATKHPLNSVPGTQYEYCNTNFIVLGLLIKKVTGQAVGDVMSERIFQPLGMANTFWPNTRFLPYPYTHGYTSITGFLLDVANWSPSWGEAAGILISNMSDLKTWIKEIYARNLLSAKSKDERFKWVDQYPTTNPGKFFYGFGLEKWGDWIGHPGIISGYNSQIFYNPLMKTTIIVTTNSDDGRPAENALVKFIEILAP